MKKQYLGDSRDSFKWDYHDHLTHTFGCPQLKIVLMLTENDKTTHGKKKPTDYPARKEVLSFCEELQEKRDPALLRSLPEKTGASYSVEFHNGGHIFTTTSRRDYFEGFNSDKDQVVFIDPDTGFEPEKSRYCEKHVQFCEVNRILEQISSESVVSIFQYARQGQSKGEFEKRYESIRSRLSGLTAAIYWDVSVMFVLLSRSKNSIRQIRRINGDYRKGVLSRRPDFKDKLRLCE